MSKRQKLKNTSTFTVDGQDILRECAVAARDFEGSPIAGLCFGIGLIDTYLAAIAKHAINSNDEKLIHLVKCLGYIKGGSGVGGEETLELLGSLGSLGAKP